MIYRKILVQKGNLKSLSKTLSNKCNCGYKFKQIFIEKIQAIYILIL